MSTKCNPFVQSYITVVLRYKAGIITCYVYEKNCYQLQQNESSKNEGKIVDGDFVHFRKVDS